MVEGGFPPSPPEEPLILPPSPLRTSLLFRQGRGMDGGGGEEPRFLPSSNRSFPWHPPSPAGEGGPLNGNFRHWGVGGNSHSTPPLQRYPPSARSAFSLRRSGGWGRKIKGSWGKVLISSSGGLDRFREQGVSAGAPPTGRPGRRGENSPSSEADTFLISVPLAVGPFSTLWPSTQRVNDPEGQRPKGPTGVNDRGNRDPTFRSRDLCRRAPLSPPLPLRTTEHLNNNLSR